MSEKKKVVSDILEILESKDIQTKDRLDILSDVSTVTIAKLILEDINDIEVQVDTYIYSILKRVYSPHLMAYHVGMIGHMLLEQHPEIIEDIQQAIGSNKSSSYVA